MAEQEDGFDGGWSRRKFLSVAAAGGAVALSGGLALRGAAAAGAGKRGIKLGFDNFSLRAFKWNAGQLLDYAATQKVDVLFISDLDAYESLEEKYLAEVRAKARDLGIEIHAGTGSVCPTSGWFNKKRGTAEEHLALAIRVAKSLGSPVVRVVLGNGGDRAGEGGIERKIEETVRVLKTARSLALDSRVKIAVENHAGDMQAFELAGLIEAAGKDYVGANVDSGNAVWTGEDPIASLEIIGPYAATTSLRESAVWESEKGAMTVWTDVGDGTLDWGTYLDKFAKLCPGVPVNIETITGAQREIAYLTEDYWKIYPKARASDLARFVAYAKRGKPYTEPADRPKGNDPDSEKTRQKWDIERSLRHCREALGLGLKA